MFSNDMKKGDEVRMRGTGWTGKCIDNGRGNTRMVHLITPMTGPSGDMGSVYVWDIAAVRKPGREWEQVELTPKQEKARAQIKAMGF